VLWIPLFGLLSACFGQDAPAPEVVAPPPPPPECVDRAELVPGIDKADPRLTADHLIVVRKADRRVQLFEKGVATAGSGTDGKACYRVGLGFAPAGHKQRQGDGKTPEGWYPTSDKPWSSFYAAIAVHYPNAQDAEAAVADGRISRKVGDTITSADKARKKPPQTTPMGGEILLHGGGSSTDWTLGCVALEDTHIDDLRSHLPKGIRVWVRVLP